MTAQQKLMVLGWNLVFAVHVLFLLLRGQPGLCVWTLLANEAFLYGTIRAWNIGVVRINGLQFTREENPTIFFRIYCVYFVFLLVFANGPGVLYLTGLLR